MSSSENEEFESADEECGDGSRNIGGIRSKAEVIERTRRQQVEPIRGAGSKQEGSQDKNNTSTVVLHKSLPQNKEVVSKGKINKDENTAKKEVVVDGSCQREDSWDWGNESNLGIEDTNRLPETKKAILKNKTIVEKVIAEEKQIVEESSGKESDYWDCDNGNNRNVGDSVVLNYAEDGWSDFGDDWGETTDLDVKKEQDLASMFPVLNEISSDRSPQKSDGILNSLSKLVKPDVVSNYQALPILDHLSESNLRTKKQNPTTKQDRENVETPPKENEKENNSNASSWGWRPWGGVVSLLSTASEGVTSLTSHVSHGISTVIGIPTPEELAKINAEKDKNKINNDTEENKPNSADDTILPSLGHIVTGVTNIGNKVITGGLDTLEGIGKKTMTILQENDPLLLNKRKFLGLETEKPILSQVLREAKEKSEEIERNLKLLQKNAYKKQLHFETLFDNYYGLVHLEALEMLSLQSSLKLQSLIDPLTGKALTELQETLNEVKELCELGDIENEDTDVIYNSDELSSKFSTAVEDLGVEIDFQDILNCWEQNKNWLEENSEADVEQIYEKGLRCLAETCALAMYKYHKIAEMLLIKDHHSTANEADSLVQLTTILCAHLSVIANSFCGKLNNYDQNELVTSIFLEVYNGVSYIQNAFQLFIPILQIGAA